MRSRHKARTVAVQRRGSPFLLLVVGPDPPQDCRVDFCLVRTLINSDARASTHKRGYWANVPLLGAPHKPTEKFQAVPPIASTIDHTGETRLGARDQSCIRPAIGTQTPWHDIRWLRLSLGTSRSISRPHLPRSPRFVFLIKAMQ